MGAETRLPQSLADNPVLQVLVGRRSCRKFEKRDVPEHVFNAILEAARLAPSTVNLQTWTLGLFTKLEWREKFKQPIPFGANRAVIIMADSCRFRAAMDDFPFKPLVEYTLSVVNASIAAYAMNIAAEACGVASVMLSETGKSGFYDARFLKKTLALPDGVFPLMTVVFGYPRGKPLGMPPKLPIEEITFRGSYKQPDAGVMESWLNQMIAGYRAANLTGSLHKRLRQYLSKADTAEQELKELIFHHPEEFKLKI